MELHIVLNPGEELTAQLVHQLREAIRSGRLSPGEQLPPSRLLASQLGVSRKVVSEAYAQLTYDKLVIGRVGAGSFVAAELPRPVRRARSQDLAGAAVIDQWNNSALLLRHPGRDARSRFEYVGGATTRALFPHDEWRRCALHALRQTAAQRGFYAEPEGLPVLRDAIARHAGFTRGVRCTAEDVVVTNGAQQALDLISRVLVKPGAVAAVEDPGYPPMRQLLRAQGAEVASVPVDAEGLIAEAIPDGTRLIYVTPAHQFPLGLPMSLARRHALLARAAELGAIIIEDDYDSDFRYGGTPLESLQSLDPHGLVAYVSTFSKSLAPELRLGFVVAPPALRQAIVSAKYLSDGHTPPMNQWTLAKFMADGLLPKHVRRCHAVYERRRETLLRRFETDLAPWFELVPAVAGFHMAALCRRPLDTALLATLCRRVDVGLYPIDPFFHGQPARPGLLLGYGAIDLLDIDPSLDRVRDVLLEMTP